MSRTTVEIAVPPERVWDVLCDPQAYGDWVVGTTEVVGADEGWPQVGTTLEYKLGAGPVSVGDRTTVVESEPGRLLLLRAELSRLGSARIRLELQRLDGGTRVVMDEDPVEGIVDTLHNPLSDEALRRRNDEALERLKRLAEARG